MTTTTIIKDRALTLLSFFTEGEEKRIFEKEYEGKYDKLENVFDMFIGELAELHYYIYGESLDNVERFNLNVVGDMMASYYENYAIETGTDKTFIQSISLLTYLRLQKLMDAGQLENLIYSMYEDNFTWLIDYKGE